MWFVWILFAIPLFLIGLVLLLLTNKILLKIQKDNEEFEKRKENKNYE